MYGVAYKSAKTAMYLIPRAEAGTNYGIEIDLNDYKRKVTVKTFTTWDLNAYITIEYTKN